MTAARPSLLVVLALAAAALTLPPPAAFGQTGGSSLGSGPDDDDRPPAANACRASRSPRLRCPDLILRMPYGRYLRRSGSRVFLHAGNSIVNVGQGPAEVFGQRSSTVGPMTVTQRILSVNGGRYSFPSPGARISFKFIPGQYGYWKFENAARFEIWTVDAQGRLGRMVRTGPKLIYCLRDLAKRALLPFAPTSRVYPACSQDPRRRSVTLGTSVGWADEYPPGYYEQYIELTGLRGRFVFIQRVDPLNGIRESNETNNVSPRVFLRLPAGAPAQTPPPPSGY